MTENQTAAQSRDRITDAIVSISVFFPCYNEQGNIARTVERAAAVLDRQKCDYEIIVVNDGSTDSTGQIAETLAKQNSRVRVVHHPVNRGYGAALQSGFGAATKKIVFFTDGDGQFDIGEMPAWLTLMKDYDIVCGFRINRQDSFVRKINGWLWTKLVCLLFGMRIRDIDCAFKLFKKQVFDNIKLSSAGALISAELLARAVRKGCRITERGVHHYPRMAGKQTGANLKVIFRAFKELFKLYNRIRSGN